VKARRPLPLHRQLTALAAVVLLLALGVSGVAADLATTAYLEDRLDTRLIDTPTDFDNQGKPDNQGAPAVDRDGDPGSGRQFSTYLQLTAPDGTVLGTQAGLDESGKPFTPDLPPVLPESVAGRSAAFFDTGSREPAGPRLRIKASVDDEGRLLIVALPRTSTDAVLRRLRLIQLSVSAGALLLASAAAWWLVRRRLGSLRRLAHAVESLRPDDPAAGVHVDTTTREVHELAIATNAMLHRIHDALAKEQATQERLRQFVADASHELRTPITAVSAYAQLFELGAKDRPADLARSMAGIQRETARMRELAEELLTLATTEDYAAPETQPVDVATVIGQAVDAALTVDPRWPVTMTLGGRPGAVAAEPDQLRRVLDNLMGNIRTHTPPGTCARVRAERHGPDVVITVADNGPGLDEQERAHMFDRFWRQDASRSRRAGGSGLGLAIVATLVKSWNGRVTAAPTPGGGLTVALSLPAADAA